MAGASDRADERALAAGELSAALGLRADQARHAMRLVRAERRTARRMRGAKACEMELAERVADVVWAFDALVNAAADEPPMSRARACAALVRDAGTRFDPDVVRTWLRVQDGSAVRHVQ
jgi:hypothetical protein